MYNDLLSPSFRRRVSFPPCLRRHVYDDMFSSLFKETFFFRRIVPSDLQGCISCGPCSYPELTEDHVLTSAYDKIFRTVTRNAVNKSV